MRTADTGRGFRRIALLTVLGIVAVPLGGCASSSIGSLLKSNSAAKQTAPAPVAFAPVIGAPPKVTKQLTGQLAAAAQQRRIPVVGSGEAAAYTVRGYLAPSPDRRGSKLAYIWDVFDTSGKRVHRITGEEIVAGKPGGDPWADVGAATLQKIAGKTATDLATWLPKQPVMAAARQAAPPTPTPRAPSSPRMASIAKSNEIMTLVPAVRGAPGDGSKSLTLAIKKQLFKKGLKLTSIAGPNVYTVRGNVSMSKPASGKQSISIDWQVLDPKGQRLGVVSQQNSIAQGSLDGAWGKTADAAAAASADGIIRLVPKKSTN